MPDLRIRFIKRFIINTTTSYINDGQIQIGECSYHIEFGKLYWINNVIKNEHNKYDIDFGYNLSQISGVAQNIEPDYFEIYNNNGPQMGNPIKCCNHS